MDIFVNVQNYYHQTIFLTKLLIFVYFGIMPEQWETQNEEIETDLYFVPVLVNMFGNFY